MGHKPLKEQRELLFFSGCRKLDLILLWVGKTLTEVKNES